MRDAEPSVRGRHPRRLRGRPSSTAALLTVGLALTLGAPLWWATHNDVPGGAAIHPGAVRRLAQPAVTRTGSGPGLAGPARSSDPPSAASHPPSLFSPVGGDLAGSGSLSRPVQLRIPALSVVARVRSVGVAADSQVAIPPDIRDVGWYRYGAVPGDGSGSVVVVGHLDSATQPGLGALAYLRTLEAGATILIATADGRVWDYRVVGREEIAKGSLPLRDIFARTGRPRLILMTCGGSFDQGLRSYDDTVVVTAVPRR